MGIKIHCKDCPASEGFDVADEPKYMCRLQPPVSIPKGENLTAYFPEVKSDDWCMKAPGQEIIPDTIDAPNTEGFPKPVWDAAVEIECKQRFPGAQPHPEQVRLTAEIIWAMIRPLYDAALAVFSNPNSILTSSDFGNVLKKWENDAWHR